MALPASASTEKTTTWRYRVVSATGASTLDWKVTSGEYAGSHGRDVLTFKGSRGLGILTWRPGGWGGGASDARRLKVTEVFSSHVCEAGGGCGHGCPKKTETYRGSGYDKWKIMERGRAVRARQAYPIAVACGVDAFDDGIVPKPSLIVPVARFKRHTLVLRSHAAVPVDESLARGTGTVRWDWREKLVRTR